MLRLAILTARKRLGTYVGAFLALFGSAVLVMAGGMLLQSALRNDAPVTRYAAAAAVVTGHQDVGPDHDVILGEPVRISSALVGRLAAVPGVGRRSPTMRFPAASLRTTCRRTAGAARSSPPTASSPAVGPPAS